MNKYIVKATAQIVGVFVVLMSVSIGCSLALKHYEPTAHQILAVIGIVLFSYILYNLIRIQADVLESTDKLNNK